MFHIKSGGNALSKSFSIRTLKKLLKNLLLCSTKIFNKKGFLGRIVTLIVCVYCVVYYMLATPDWSRLVGR